MNNYIKKKNNMSTDIKRGGCSSAGRAGRVVIGRSLVQIPALGRAELHVEVSLSEILNPTLLMSEGAPCPRPETRLGLAPWKGISGSDHDMTWQK